MKKIIIASILLLSCKENKGNVTQNFSENKTVSGTELTDPESNAEVAKNWLEKSIKNYFNAKLGDMDKRMKEMTTEDYYEYKTDATNVDMYVDGSLTEKEFVNKWKNKFNTKYAGMNTGFLIPAQDWINIEIRKCNLKSSTKNIFIFDVELADDGFKAKYYSKIKVIKINDKYLIADILEDNEQ